MNTMIHAQRTGYVRAVMVAAALSAGGLVATGGEAAACQPKFDRLGGYHRFHANCGNTYVKVSVECKIGTVHTSSYYRWGYNKAQCHEKSEGNIVAKNIHTCKSCKRG